ncbi:MAG: methyltransferase [Bacillota bacterium]
MTGGEHYFAPRDGLGHEYREVKAHLRGREFSFLTDAGVFAKTGLDPGSRLLIEAMAVAEADMVLDLGCGWGAMGLAAAALASRGRAYLVDINPRAVELARENARRNRLTNVDVRQGDGTAPLEGQRFDVVLLNPPVRAGKDVVHRLIAEAWAALVPGGSLWLVIRKQQGAESLRRHLETLFVVERRARDQGYHVLQAVRGSGGV